MKKRTCEDLGVCQSRAECHATCSSPPRKGDFFAPGTIDGPYKGQRSRSFFTFFRSLTLIEALLLGASLALITAALGFSFGYFNVFGWLP